MRAGRGALQAAQVSRQVADAIDDAHDFDPIGMRLKEN